MCRPLILKLTACPASLSLRGYDDHAGARMIDEDPGLLAGNHPNVLRPRCDLMTAEVSILPRLAIVVDSLTVCAIKIGATDAQFRGDSRWIRGPQTGCQSVVWPG